MNVIVERDVTAAMRDGVRLAANIYRPEDEGRYPVLLMRLPYGKDVYAITNLALDPIRAAAAGYVVVHQDCRGRGNSEGVFDPFRDDPDDGFDSVEWAAALPNSNGEVGIYGVSYPGWTSWAAAAADPPGLRAAAPSQAPLHHRALLWHGGAFELGLFLFWNAYHLGIPELARQRTGAPTFGAELADLVSVVDAFEQSADLFERGELRLGPGDIDLMPYFEDAPDRAADERRGPRTIDDAADAVTVPILITAGWHDLLLHQDLAAFAELQARPAGDPVRERSRLVAGPWTHGPGMHFPAAGEVDFGVRAGGMSLDLVGDLTRHHLDFFDAEMGGGEASEAPVRIFTMGRNRWRYEDQWPPRGAKEEPWYLGPEGELGRRPPEGDDGPCEFLHDPEDPCPTRGGRTMLPAAYPRGPVDQAPILGRKDVLLYTSEPLEAELEVTGEVRAVLFAATSGRAADWVVKLCDVRPDERVFNVCDGILRTDTQSGEFEISLGGTSFAFAPGHRLGLIVSSADHPRYDRNPDASAGPQLVFADRTRPSRVLLPVIG